MPLHDEESIHRVMNLVNPSDINIEYQDYRTGEVIVYNRQTESFDYGDQDDDLLLYLEDRLDDNDSAFDFEIVESGGGATAAAVMSSRSSDPAAEEEQQQVVEEEISPLFSGRPLNEDTFDTKSNLNHHYLIVKTPSELKNKNIGPTLSHDADETASLGGSSCMTGSTTYTRRHIPERLQKTLRMQLANYLEKSEKSLMSADGSTTGIGDDNVHPNDSHLTKLKIRKRILEQTMRQPMMYQHATASVGS